MKNKKEGLPIGRSLFIQMSKLTNLKGRINYISSHARQENLYPVYETTDRTFWKKLAKCNREEFSKSGTEGKCIEARELIIAMPESFTEYEPKALLKLFTEHFKQIYGVECIAALHHNKRKTNYHIHLIFSERKWLEEPMEKIATRNMFYDENGKHVRTRKEILDEAWQVRKGCKIISKGEAYERKLFTTKDSKFKSENFLEGVKQSYTNLINIYVRDDKERLQVFDRNGEYLPMKKIGKNNPKAEQMKTDNEIRKNWNQTVDRALVIGVPERQIMQVKDSEISGKARESIKQLSILKQEVDNTKGVFKGKQRKELQEQTNQLEIQIENMKYYLSNIVKGYGYRTVSEFLTEYSTAKAEHADYEKAVADWEKKYGIKAESDGLKARLEKHKQQIVEHGNRRQRTYYYSEDKSAR